MDILELEGCNGGGAVEEEGLAVAAILYENFISIVWYFKGTSLDVGKHILSSK